MNIVHLIDCMDFMKDKPDNCYDIGFPDPEYGLGENGGICRSSYVRQKNGKNTLVRGDYPKKHWDKKPASIEYFTELFRITKNQIIWGCNNYQMNFGPGRIIWDKYNDGSSQSDCEIAYNSLNKRIDRVVYMWRGMMQGKSISEGNIQQGDKSKNEKRIHPTQKPVLLYKWILEKYIESGWNVFDSHVGSGSLRIACHDMGFDFEGCEIDADYYKAQEKRYQIHAAQGDLFNSDEMQRLIF